jgi:hypothetical protein
MINFSFYNSTFLPIIFVLANFIVQKILNKIKETRGSKKSCMIPRLKEFELIEMLLNQNVTEFNSYSFENECSKLNHKRCYRLVLEQCPRMTKVVQEHCDCWEGQQWHDYSFNCLQTWTNLKHLNFRGVFCCDRSMRLIQENCPLLESVISLYFFIKFHST